MNKQNPDLPTLPVGLPEGNAPGGNEAPAAGSVPAANLESCCPNRCLAPNILTNVSPKVLKYQAFPTPDVVVMNQFVHKSLPYDPFDDFVPITLTAKTISV